MVELGLIPTKPTGILLSLLSLIKANLWKTVVLSLTHVSIEKMVSSSLLSMFDITVVMTAYYATYCDSSNDYRYLHYLSVSNGPKVTNFGGNNVSTNLSNGKREEPRVK